MKDAIYISRNKNEIEVDKVILLLRQTDWACDRAEEEIIKSITNSTCYFICRGKELIGFARIITDFVTTFYLMDVIIDETYRGKGLGKRLMNEIMEDVGDLYGILHTNSAQRFYESYGFKITSTSSAGESIMEKKKGMKS